jgi:hypothetical protein
MKALETEYRGYRFRSRLEARWAVFFDACRIEWEYEPEGYELTNGTRYLPDFWLPKFHGGIFVEVKPSGGDFTKARAFADEGDRILLAEGSPHPKEYELAGEIGCAGEVCFCSKYLPDGSNESEHRFYVQPAGCAFDMAGMVVLNAVGVSRAARFGQ